jgi:membrane-associated phospholipid phosphatase
VKVRTFRAPRNVLLLAAGLRTLLRGFAFRARQLWWSLPLVVVLAFLLAWFLFPRDHHLLARLHAIAPAAEPAERQVAAFFGTWGDYPTYNLPLALALWLYGTFTHKRAWRRFALVCFLGATCAGLLDDCFRLTLGRPRPDAHMVDGFYGLHSAFHARYQSFPSGHAAAVFGTSTALLCVDLPLGLLTTIYSLLVVWARMELDRHYPSDVAVGALIGLWLGLLVGLGARAALPPKKSRSSR